jgi:3-oxoacyl-[acyl-carrier protein] reductase
MNRLQGKVALITGAGRGLGLATARRFAEEGAQVIINDLTPAGAGEAARQVDGVGMAADVADSAAVAGMFRQVAEKFGRLDILVNNAGINGMENNPEKAEKFVQRQLAQAREIKSGGRPTSHLDFTVEITDAEWHRMLAVHLHGTFYCTREALKIMSPQLSGAIINVASIQGTSGGAGLGAYNAAKGGILAFSRSVARDVVSRNIRVNTVAPGWIATEMGEALGAFGTVLLEETPMHRFGEPDDVAWAMVYLASEEAKFLTGQVISPNGGWYMSQ